MFREFKFIAFVALLSFVGCGGATQPKSIIHTGQIISISDTTACPKSADTVRFGRLSAGETGVKELRMRNTTQHPVVIRAYTRTCGCTTFEFDPQPIAPNQETTARLSFDTQGLQGWQFKLIEIEFAGGAAPQKIYVDAEVE
ncbi:MAG: DUF1573 domain-containing protein [Alistipes sp.]